MSYDRPGLKNQTVSEANLGETQEHTLAGKLVGSVRDLFFGSPKNAQDAAERASSNDMIGEIVANTVSMLPDMHFLAAGGLRAGLLYDPSGGIGDNVGGLGKNFAEGVALNGVARLSGKLTGLGTSADALTAHPLLGQAAGGFGFGFGMSAVTTAFDGRNWQINGQFSFTTGLENIAKAGTIGGAIGVPAGLVAGQVARIGGNAMLEAGLPTRLVQVTVGAGSGYAAGAVFGGAESALHGGSWQAILGSASESGLIGLATGGVIGGVGPAGELHAARASSQFERPAVNQEARSISSATPAAEAVGAHSGETVFGIAMRNARSFMPYDNLYDRVLFQPHEQSLDESLAELRPGRTREVSLRRFNPAIGDVSQFKSFDEFNRNALAVQLEPMRVYKFDNTSILVPREYAQQLDEVLKLRLQASAKPGDSQWSTPELVAEAQRLLDAHPLKDRAHPADMVPYLKSLPDRRLVKELRLLDEENPEDPWHRATCRPDFTSAATASRDGVVTFYKADRTPSLAATWEHEWSHLLKFATSDEAVAFTNAEPLEKDWHVSNYAKRNVEENWAEHSQALIGSNADLFFKTMINAPIRSAIIGRALQRSLDLVPPEQRSPYHEQLQERVHTLSSTALPNAQRQLEMFALRQSTTQQQRVAALNTLRFLASDDQIPILRGIAKTDTDPSVAEAAYNAAWHRVFEGKGQVLRYNYTRPAETKDAQIDFLIDVARPGSRVRDLALDQLDSMLGARAENWYQLLTIDKYSGDRLGRLLKIAQEIPDRAGKQEAWRQIKSNSGSREMQLVMAAKVLERVPELRSDALDLLVAYADPRMAQIFEQVIEQAKTPELAEKAELGLRRIQTQEKLAEARRLLASPVVSERMKAISSLADMQDVVAITPLLERVVRGTSAEAEATANALRDNYENQLVKYYAQAYIRDFPEARSVLQPLLEKRYKALSHLNQWHDRGSRAPA